jgi:hypothetical protein
LAGNWFPVINVTLPSENRHSMEMDDARKWDYGVKGRRGGGTMSDDKRDILETLKFELAFLEQGGYGLSVHTPRTPTRIFQDSLSCLNFGEPTQPHPCSECFLTDFVPPDAQSAQVPCHHIPLNPKGETAETLGKNQLKLEEALENWLRGTIRRIEQERAVAAAPKRTSEV